MTTSNKIKDYFYTKHTKSKLHRTKNQIAASCCCFIQSDIIFQDRYILGSMTFNWLVCVWHGIISRFDHNPSYQEDLDFWAFIVLIIIYVIFQVLFYLLVLIKVSRTHALMISVKYVSL